MTLTTPITHRPVGPARPAAGLRGIGGRCGRVLIRAIASARVAALRMLAAHGAR